MDFHGSLGGKRLWLNRRKDYGLIDAVIYDGKPGLVAPVADLVESPKTQHGIYGKLKEVERLKRICLRRQKISQNGHIGKEAGDGETGSEQDKEAPVPV